MTNLIPGGNAPIPTGQLTVNIHYSPISGADIDISAFQLKASGKVRGDGDMCFYGQTSIGNGAIQLAESSTGRAVFKLDPTRVEPAIEKIALTATIHENRAKFAACTQLSVSVSGAGGEPIQAPISTQGMQESALILGEFYRRNGQWKFRLVAQGFAGGLSPLAQHFGVEIAASDASPAPAPTQNPPPVPTPAPARSNINLSKITLDKRTSSISLDKKADFGEIKINLNWNQRSSGGSGGLFGFGKSKGIDLDLGCLFELQDGQKGAVQALGNAFGSYHHAPYIELLGDDRTGAVSDGEWMRINGKFWKDVKRICIYAFIYEGAPNWEATDGIVTVYAPGQPPIEVRLNEEGGRYGMCGIALLENVGGAVKIKREVMFFKGHRELDKHYGWGMRWSAGSK